MTIAHDPKDIKTPYEMVCRTQDCWPSLGMVCPTTRYALLENLERQIKLLKWAFGIDEDSPHDDKESRQDLNQLARSARALASITADLASR